MPEKRVRVTADLILRTEVDVILYEGDTVESVMDAITNEGIKQYIKDYDPDLGYQGFDVKIVKFEVLASGG